MANAVLRTDQMDPSLQDLTQAKNSRKAAQIDEVR